MRECRPHLLTQFPQLTSISGEDVTEENAAAWMAARVKEHGDVFAPTPLPPGVHEQIDPLSELVEKVHPSRIIVVSNSSGGDASSAD